MTKKKYYIYSLKIFLYLICLFIGFGFGTNFYNTSESHRQAQLSKIDSLKKTVIEMGHIPAYHILKNEFRKKRHPQEYLLYSIVMADKYNYAPANYDVYYCLTSVFDSNPSLGKIDKRTKELALYFLERGAKLNDPVAKKEINKLENK